MILLIQEPDNERLKQYAIHDNNHVYSIYFDGEFVGVVEYKYSGDIVKLDSLYIDKWHQGCGIGRKVVEMIKDRHKTAICGDSVTEAVGFWKAVGADFDGEDDDLDYYQDNCLCVPFIIE